MSILQLRTWAMKTGRSAIVFGVMAVVGGLFLGNGMLVGTGCLTAFFGAYAVAFGQVGAF